MTLPKPAANRLQPQKVSPGSSHEVLVATPIAVSLLVLLGWILVRTVLRNVEVSQAELDAVREALASPLPMFVHPEPVERWLFILLCLAAPLCGLAAMGIARPLCRCLRGLKPSLQTGLAVAAGLALFGVVFIKTSFGFWLFPFQVKGDFFGAFPSSYWVDSAAIVLAAGIGFLGSPSIPAFPGRGWLSFRLATRNQCRIWGVCVALLSVAIVFLPRGLSIDSTLSNSISKWSFRYHFQAAAFGLTQIYAGKALSLVTPLYGGYAQFLLPVFRVVGLSVFKFSLVLTTLFSIALVSSAAVMARFIRQPAVLFFSAAAVLYTLTNAWSAGEVPFDPYFQYWPVHVLFPALSAPFYLWVARRTERTPWVAMGVFCGAALCWNLDSGIAVAGATVFTLVAETLSRLVGKTTGAGSNGNRWWNLALAVAAMAAVFLGFSWYLQWAAHGVRPLHTTAEYQRLYYEFGFMMIAIPDGLHPWMAIVTIYLFALILGMRSFLDGCHSPFARLSVYLSILGTGLFTYYQGRSHDYNLLAAAWPAILLGCLLTDRLFRAIRAGVYAPGLRWLAFFAIYYGVVCLLLLPNRVATLAEIGLPNWRTALFPPAAPSSESMRDQIDFIRAHAGADRACVILTLYQAVHFAETGLRFQYNLPGITELFYKTDRDALRKALANEPARHLFVDAAMTDLFELSPVLASRYRVVATCPGGEISYLEPK